MIIPIRELFFKEATLQKREVNRHDIEKLLDYLNTSGDEGTQFDAKDFGAIITKTGQIALDKVRVSLAKHVSAFANSSGGLIAIGICEYKTENFSSEHGGKTKFFYKGHDISKINLQHLQRVMATSVEPRPEFSLEVVEMEKGKGRGHRPKGLILVYVEQSMTPPHQSLYNRIYYFRHGESSNPAPHALVMALFGQRRRPDLELDLIKVSSKSGSKNGKWFQRLIIRNKGTSPAFFTHIIINIFPMIKNKEALLFNKTFIENSSDGVWKIKEFLGSEEKNFMKFRFRASQEQILLPGVNEILFDFPLGSFSEVKLMADFYCEGFEGHQEFNLF